jgi:hypothetical protein
VLEVAELRPRCRFHELYGEGIQDAHAVFYKQLCLSVASGKLAAYDSFANILTSKEADPDR